MTNVTSETILAVVFAATLNFATIHIVIALLDSIITILAKLNRLLFFLAMIALQWVSFRAGWSEVLASLLTESFASCNFICTSQVSRPRIVAVVLRDVVLFGKIREFFIATAGVHI